MKTQLANVRHVGPVSGLDELLSGRHAAITDKQFNLIRGIARERAGIAIADFKCSMVRRRVSKRLQALGIQDLDDYCALLAGPQGEAEIQPLINALTTNKTDFFREKHHFDHMENVSLPQLMQRRSRAGSRKLRIWSAGCSSGEEPYSIAMTVFNSIPDLSAWDVKILATDIDTEILLRAEKGLYTLDEIGAIPALCRVKHLEPVPGENERFCIARSTRALITFKRLNLHDTWPMRGPFDIIFCRNVVIYFDKPTQKSLYERFANLLAQDGYLYCGHSESLFGLCQRFEPAGKSVYEKIA